MEAHSLPIRNFFMVTTVNVTVYNELLCGLNLAAIIWWYDEWYKLFVFHLCVIVVTLVSWVFWRLMGSDKHYSFKLKWAYYLHNYFTILLTMICRAKYSNTSHNPVCITSCVSGLYNKSPFLCDEFYLFGYRAKRWKLLLHACYCWKYSRNIPEVSRSVSRAFIFFSMIDTRATYCLKSPRACPRVCKLTRGSTICWCSSP